jgi:beta-phosphoglucomutase
VKTKAIIFDVDGVLVRTDALHEQSWRTLAQQEGLPFPEDLPVKLRGVSREKSLQFVLGDAFGRYTDGQRTEMMERKNAAFLQAVHAMSPADALPGVRELLNAFRSVLARVELTKYLDAIVDGHDAPKAKPDPQCFLLAADKLHADPANSVVVEDAPAGVQAALNAGMAVVGVGPCEHDPRVTLGASSLANVTAADLIQLADRARHR